MSNPPNKAQKAMNLSSNVFMSSTTKFVKGTNLPPAQSSPIRSSIPNDFLGIVGGKTPKTPAKEVSQQTTLQSNGKFQRSPKQFEKAQSPAANKPSEVPGVKGSAMNLIGGVFMNSTTRYVKNQQDNGPDSTRKFQRKKVEETIQSPQTKKVQNNQTTSQTKLIARKGVNQDSSNNLAANLNTQSSKKQQYTDRSQGKPKIERRNQDKGRQLKFIDKKEEVQEETKPTYFTPYGKNQNILKTEESKPKISPVKPYVNPYNKQNATQNTAIEEKIQEKKPYPYGRTQNQNTKAEPTDQKVEEKKPFSRNPIKKANQIKQTSPKVEDIKPYPKTVQISENKKPYSQIPQVQQKKPYSTPYARINQQTAEKTQEKKPYSTPYPKNNQQLNTQVAQEKKNYANPYAKNNQTVGSVEKQQIKPIGNQVKSPQKAEQKKPYSTPYPKNVQNQQKQPQRRPYGNAYSKIESPVEQKIQQKKSTTPYNKQNKPVQSPSTQKVEINPSKKQNEATQQKQKTLVLKKSSLVGFVMSRLHRNKLIEAFSVLRSHKLTTVKHTAQATILSFSVDQIYIIKYTNVLLESFSKIKYYCLSSFAKEKKTMKQPSVNYTHSVSFLIQRLFSSKIRKTFMSLVTYKNQVNYKSKHLSMTLDQLFKRKSKDNTQGFFFKTKALSNKKMRTFKQLSIILQFFHKEKVYESLRKMRSQSLEVAKKQIKNIPKEMNKVASSKNISPAIEKETPSSIDSPIKNKQAEQKIKKLTKQNENLNKQVANLQKRKEEKRKQTNNEVAEINKRKVELKGIIRTTTKEINEKKRKNEELKSNIDNIQLGSNQQLQSLLEEPTDCKLNLLTEIYSFIFKHTEQTISLTEFLNSYNIKLDESNSTLQEWNALSDNLQIKKQISLYENVQPREYRARANLKQEQDAISKLVKSYIRERYLWQWIRLAASSV